MQASIQVTVTPPRWLRTRTRRKVAAIALTVGLLIPGLALASHNFTDVPDSSTFHTNIARVYGARITAGCTATTYCPTENVSREQMAAFLARSSGRVAADEFDAVAVTTTQTTVGSVTIKAGDVPGGYANILLHVDVSAYGYSAPSAAQLRVRLSHDGSTVDDSWIQVGAIGPAGYAFSSTSIGAVVTVPTGVNQTFAVQLFKEAGTTTTSGLGSITATYIPFSGLGQNPSIAAPAAEPGSGVGPPKP